MKIYITAKPRSKKEYVKRVDDTHYIVSVNAPPVDGKANQAIIKSLAKYFDKPKSQIYILTGASSKRKVIEMPVTDDELDERETQKKLF